MEFAGEFETHITVGLDASESLMRLQEWATSQGLKCLHIVLDRGATLSQAMLTRRGRGTLSEELTIASGLSRALNTAGFEVVRVKIEAALWNMDVPQAKTDVSTHSPERYFEHHIKLLLARCEDTAALADIAERNAAHLSRNALKVRIDGYEERFVTQRCRSVGRAEARQQLDALVNSIMPLGYPILDVEEEFVVYDSNHAIDSGWICGEEM